MICVIDNYDSFVYNLCQYIGVLDSDICVYRNDAITPQGIVSLHCDGIILSPGPGHPEGAGSCIDIVKEVGQIIPILGICLGHQAIICAFGGKVGYADTLMHGKQSCVSLDLRCRLFDGLESQIKVGRYHSLSANRTSLPNSLKVVAQSDDGEIMAVQHRTEKVYGLQFHPESILTPDGMKIVENFIDITKEGKR